MVVLHIELLLLFNLYFVQITLFCIMGQMPWIMKINLLLSLIRKIINTFVKLLRFREFVGTVGHYCAL